MATISTTTFEPVYYSGGYKLQPSYLEKSKFKRVQQTNSDEREPEEITIGGYSILDTTSQIGLNTRKNGGGNSGPTQPDGLTQISHLSIPIGLVLTKKYTKNCYGNDIDNLKCSVIEDSNFDKLYDMTHIDSSQHNNTKKSRKTKSKNTVSKKDTKKKRTIKK